MASLAPQRVRAFIRESVDTPLHARVTGMMSSHSPALKAVTSGIGFAAAVASWRDYRQWRSLGDGGVPANVLGYLSVTALRVIKREPYNPTVYDRLDDEPFNGSWITELAPRTGPRPTVDPHPIPQRQTDQHGNAALVEQTTRLFDDVVASDPKLIYAPSGFETRHQAITVVAPYPGHDTARRAKGEVAHVHPSDGSMHMIFSPHDAKKVLDAGWGERHSLAGIGPLPLSYLLIYAARDQAEIAVISGLLGASIAYMTQSCDAG